MSCQRIISVSTINCILLCVSYLTTVLAIGNDTGNFLRGAELIIDVNSTLSRYLKSKVRSSTTDEKTKGFLPTIFIVGAQKGGSMSLVDLLMQHPHICIGKHKETHFFNNDENYEKGGEWYKNQFIDSKCTLRSSKSKFIDGTPILHIPDVWKRIQKLYDKEKVNKDNLKFIVLLREPVTRDYTWYQHVIRAELHNGEKFTTIKTIKEINEVTNFQGHDGLDTRRGRYVEQLENFTKYFKRNQIMIISSSAIFRDSIDIMERIRKFIDVLPDDSINKPLPHLEHASQTGIAFELCALRHIPKMECAYRDKLATYYAPYNEKLYEWIEETKTQADLNEPEFLPLFEDSKGIECVEDARVEFDAFLEREVETVELREIYHTKTWGFHLPDGACRLVSN